MHFFFEVFPSILELFLNLLQLFAIIISIFTFFFLMLNKFSYALKSILEPCGLGFWARIRILLICRNSQHKKRAFVEYAILKTAGKPIIHSEWHTLINRFKAFYLSLDQGKLQYSVPNCTCLLSEEFSEAVERYFNYFDQKHVKKAFGIQGDLYPWVLSIRIEEAYVTPTCLLTGLLSHYNESWEEFIKRYVSTAYITEVSDDPYQNVLSNELYFTFAWLLWGPSYELNYERYWAGLCQLSYGDESNSLPAFADINRDVADRLRNKFLENNERRYGALISTDLSLYNKKPFIKSLRSNVNPDNAYFYEKIEDGDFSFALQINGFTPYTNYKAQKYYCTAYVWILFELDDDTYAFQPEKSVAFFEHANLANRGIYQFLTETLIEKSLRHFETIYADPKNAGRRYRFVCAMNDRIANSCIEKYRQIMESGSPLGNLLKDRIRFDPKYTPAEVFSAYDAFFVTSTIHYEEVSISDQSTVSALGQFYTDVYMESFPDENERENFDNFIRYLKKSGQSDAYNYHIILAKDEKERVVGGCVFNYFKRTNVGVIEFLAVRSDLQSAGLGSQIYKHVLTVLAEDAYKFCKKTLEYICCEIDSPEYSRAKVKKYLNFWAKNNYHHLDFHYIQPPLSKGQASVTGLWFTIAPQQGGLSEVSSQKVLDILQDYFQYAFSISDPENNREYIRMKEELEKMDVVPCSPII